MIRVGIEKRNMKTSRLQRDAVQADSDRDIERTNFVTDAEFDIARQSFGSTVRILVLRTRRDKSQFLAFGIDDQNTRFLQAARRQVEISSRVDADAVAAVFRSKVDQSPAFPVDQSVSSQWKCINLHRSGSRLFVTGADRVRSVVVVDDVERLLVRTQCDPVRLFDVVRDFDH